MPEEVPGEAVEAPVPASLPDRARRTLGALGADPASPVKQVELGRGLRFLRFWLLVLRAFNHNRGPLRAAALAYGSLLALVPTVAVALSVGFGLLKQQGEAGVTAVVNRSVDYLVPEQSGQVDLGLRREIAGKIQEFVGQTRNVAVGFTSVVVLLLLSLGLLGRVENSMNDIWGVSRGRPWMTRAVYYLAALVLGPMVLAAALAITGSREMAATGTLIANFPLIGDGLRRLALEALTLLVLTLACAIFYWLLPSTHVRWRAALAGGLVAGLLLQLNNWLSVLYVARVAFDSLIYGKLGLVPVVMVGMYLFWLILLFGAQTAFAVQHRRVLFR